ncbi:MAG: hypothetical protein MI923_05390 [Phycisphaerales bacterium]|nr:hypothetical protein [Phycisphaerales bacterium]
MSSSNVLRQNSVALRWGGFLVTLVPLSGCAAYNAELVIDDRPLLESGETRYYVLHVGDQPTLRLHTKFMPCSYANLHDGLKEAYDDCGPALASGFSWPYTFDRRTPGDQPARLTVRGYRQNGFRDYMPFRGALLEAESERDPPDSLVATASVLVRVYQSAVDMTVSLPFGKPVWRLSKLTLIGENGRKTLVRYRKDARDGFFTVEGPDTAGQYRVHYEPKISQIHRSQPTQVELVVADEAAETTTFKSEIRAPYQ